MTEKTHRKSRLHGAVARYRDARRSLHTPASPQSRYGLDWMNFFVADVQTGFGAFVAFYLAHRDWSVRDVGFVLTIGSLASVLSQIPGGALADAMRWKRGLIAAGIAMIGVAALILAFTPSYIPVLLASLVQGVSGGAITPAIGAISLGLVGRRGMSLRTGRNYRYAAAGHAATAALMGFLGAYFELGMIFVAAAALCIPALIALTFIRPEEIDYARARNARTRDQAPEIGRILDLCKNRSLVLFTAAIVLFQLADASMLPLIGENLARTQATGSSIWMSGLIIVPQIVVAILAPWVGYHSEKRGRKPLLLIGFGVEPLRAALLAFSNDYTLLVIGTAIVRHYRRRHWRIDCPCRHRPDRRHRTIQLGAGRRRRDERHRRLDKHAGHRFPVSRNWYDGWIPRHHRRRRRRNGLDRDVCFRDQARRLRRMSRLPPQRDTHSTFMLAALMIGHHFSASDF